MNIRVLFDETVNNREVILCFREIDREKQKQLEEHTLLVNSLNKAVQSDKAKQVFFSNMSHEMRTPLNAIINLAGIAKNSVKDAAKVTQYLEKIEGSSRHLIQLVNDILEISKLTQGKRRNLILTWEVLAEAEKERNTFTWTYLRKHHLCGKEREVSYHWAESS